MKFSYPTIFANKKKEKKSILEGARPIDHNKMIQLSNDIKHNLSEIDRKY